MVLHGACLIDHRNHLLWHSLHSNIYNSAQNKINILIMLNAAF